MSETPSTAAAPLSPPAQSFWTSVRQALRGESNDYTSLPLNRAVLLLAVPMVLEMLMESVFTIVDIFWVGGLGRTAIAVVGLTESVMSLVYAVAIGISFAATAIVSRRIGEKNPELAAGAAGQILLLGAVLASSIGIGLGWFAGDILRLMGADADVVAHGTNYARIMFGGNATVFFIFIINAIFRGAGDATLAMRTLILANSLNLILDPCLIYGWGPFPELGVTGAAVATNIGRGIGVLYQLWHLTGRAGRVRILWKDLRPKMDSLLIILRTSANGIAQMLIATTSWVGLFKILALFGSPVLAGYTIAIRVVIFALMPAWGLANAGATLVGQNLGAGHPERAASAVKIAARYNATFLGLLGLIFIVLVRPIVGCFTTDPEVFNHAVRALWIVCLAFPLYAIGMCLEGAFNGSGDTGTPTRLNFFCFWCGQVPLAWLLAKPLGLGPTGVFIAVPVSFTALTLCSSVLFSLGKWKQKKL
jgi:putative MATE family efflux protein